MQNDIKLAGVQVSPGLAQQLMQTDPEALKKAKLEGFRRVRKELELEIRREALKVERCQRQGLRHKNHLPKLQQKLARLVASAQMIGLSVDDLRDTSIGLEQDTAPRDTAPVAERVVARGLNPNFVHIDDSPFKAPDQVPYEAAGALHE